MITQHTFSFLKELSENNNRDWFEVNKPVFEKQQPTLAAVQISKATFSTITDLTDVV